MQFMNSIKGGKQTSLIGQNRSGQRDTESFWTRGLVRVRGSYGSVAGVGAWRTLGGAKSHKSQHDLKGFQVKGFMLVGNQLVWNASLGGLNTRGGQNSPLNKSVSLYKAAIVSLMASTVTEQTNKKKTLDKLK